MNAQRPGVSSRARRLWRPAAAGPIRYWQEQLRLAVKGAVAAAAAWTIARYAVGEPDPYFAPLAALLGVYPTVARSLRESLQYAAGFLLGAALAIPVGVLLGPSIPAIALIVFIGVLISAWPLLGDQSPQVTFTALFALLLAGHQPLHYVLPRLVDVAIGVATGLVVNAFLFPPLQLRPAEHAVGRLRNDLARALDSLAGAADDPDRLSSWPQHDRQVARSAEQTRETVRRARESLRWNLRAKAHQRATPDSVVIDTLEELATHIRAVGRHLLDSETGDGRPGLQKSFGRPYAQLLRALAPLVCEVGDLQSAGPGRDDLAAAARLQHRLEQSAGRPDGPAPNADEAAGRTDEAAGSADDGLVRLTSRILQDIAEYAEHRSSADQGVRK